MSIRKALAYIISFSLSCGIFSLIVFSQSYGTITSVTSSIDKNAQYSTASVQSGMVMEYPLTADMFEWSGSPGSVGEPITLSQLRQGNITVKHNISSSNLIKEVILATTSYLGQTTACVRIEFAEEFVSVNSREFKLTIYLSISNTRMSASEITLNGYFENEEITVSSGDEYISLAGGIILIVNDYISNLEIDMGDGVQLFTKVSSGKKYYASAQNKILNADDAMVTKHPEIEAAIRLKTINLSPTGKCVSLRDVGSYHVYNASGAYLGKTDELVAFAELYYLTANKIDMGSGFSAKPDGSGKSEEKPKQPPIGDSPEEKAAKSGMDDAAKEAAKAGSDTANVKVKDVESVSASELQAMFDAASAKGMKSKYTADTMTQSGSSVEGRIILNPTLAVKLPGDIQLGVYTRDSKTLATKNFVKKYYKNKFAVVSLAHEGSYWMPVSIVAKVKLDDLNAKNLYFYSYDKGLKRLNRIVNPQYYIDSNGYLHFTTILASEIIVSDGALSKKQ